MTIVKCKPGFVDDLGTLLCKHCKNIVSVEFARPGARYGEEVVVTYKGGHKQVINVSTASIPIMLRDIINQIDL